jgi:Big-like domain-containing protein
VTRRVVALAALAAAAGAAGTVGLSSGAFTAHAAGTATLTTASDWLAPVVTLTMPADGALTNDTTPTLSGAAGSLTGDGATITVRVYSGATATGTPVQTRTTTRAGATWTVNATTLASGTYTAHASQTDTSGNTGTSAARTFTVDTVRPSGTAIAATNGGANAGRPESGDVITFSFGEAITATSILAGWDGTSRAVQVRFTNSTGTGLDTFHVRETGSATSVRLDNNVLTFANVVTNTVSFAATMLRAADGRSVSVTLGAPDVPVNIVAGTSGLVNMRWTTIAGPLDLAGNAINAAAITETDVDRDF